MIELELSVTGGMIGRKLADDPEEAMYALDALAEDAAGAFFDDIADMIAGETAERVAAFARRLADVIENRG